MGGAAGLPELGSGNKTRQRHCVQEYVKVASAGLGIGFGCEGNL